MNGSVQSNIIKKMFGVNDMKIDIQLFADVEKGNFSNNRLSDNDNNTQFYGLAGNDTIESGGRNAILIGGSGNDILHMLRGKGTLNGGAGNDTFGFDYSTGSTIDALIPSKIASSSITETPPPLPDGIINSTDLI